MKALDRIRYAYARHRLLLAPPPPSAPEPGQAPAPPPLPLNPVYDPEISVALEAYFQFQVEADDANKQLRALSVQLGAALDVIAHQVPDFGAWIRRNQLPAPTAARLLAFVTRPHDLPRPVRLDEGRLSVPLTRQQATLCRQALDLLRRNSTRSFSVSEIISDSMVTASTGMLQQELRNLRYRHPDTFSIQDVRRCTPISFDPPNAKTYEPPDFSAALDIAAIQAGFERLRQLRRQLRAIYRSQSQLRPQLGKILYQRQQTLAIKGRNSPFRQYIAQHLLNRATSYNLINAYKLSAGLPVEPRHSRPTRPPTLPAVNGLTSEHATRRPEVLLTPSFLLVDLAPQHYVITHHALSTWLRHQNPPNLGSMILRSLLEILPPDQKPQFQELLRLPSVAFSRPHGSIAIYPGEAGTICSPPLPRIPTQPIHLVNLPPHVRQKWDSITRSPRPSTAERFGF